MVPTNTRLIVDAPATGAWNMAVDQALLHSAENDAEATLRFYRWSKPVLSLGYFQAASDRARHAASLNCDLVRRGSGGGAIVHDHELTYSLSLPSSTGWAKRNTELYEIVHEQIVDVLASFGVPCDLYKNVAFENEVSEGNRDEAFLCFQRRTPGDIVSGNHKVCGSAQRRLKRSLLQHGSILLQSSQFAPELLGVNDLIEANVAVTKLTNQLGMRIGDGLGISLTQSELRNEEIELASEFESSRFLSEAWTLKR